MPSGKGNKPIDNEKEGMTIRNDLNGINNFLMLATSSIYSKDGRRSDEAARFMEWALVRYGKRALFIILSEKKDIYNPIYVKNEREYYKEPAKKEILPNPHAIEFVEQFKPLLNGLSIDDLFTQGIEVDFSKISGMLFNEFLYQPEVSHINPVELPEDVQKRWDVDFTSKNHGINVKVEVVDEIFELEAVTPIKNLDSLHTFLGSIKKVHFIHSKSQ
ncbi:MAG: hypothetical protein NTW30_01065 [Candidatus Aenigmarchaeota archaeon]|nr:hypothetical protein [Candidatus Aenigmarchaeota archaeon]